MPPRGVNSPPLYGGDHAVSGLGHRIAELAARQHGIVARRQLIAAGIGDNAIDRRLAEGQLHLVHKGVYAVGHRRLMPDGRRMAAVLASGDGAVLSHRAAGAMHGIHASERLEVTVPRRRRPVRGVDLHRAVLPTDEVTAIRGIPVTTSPRTLLDLATVLGRHQLERAVHEAEYRQILDPLSLPDLIARYPRRRGNKAIRSALAKLQFGANVPKKELEKRFLGLADTARLPLFDANAYICAGGRWFECDCVWREQRVILELDGRAAHGTSAAFESDRERDRILQAEGWRVIRVTWRQLHDQPHSVVADLRRLLG